MVLLSCAFLLAVAGCAGTTGESAHRQVLLQVSDADPKSWNAALNIAQLMRKNYAQRGVEQVDIEIVAIGGGIQMLRDDASVANRVRDVIGEGTDVVACEVSMRAFKLPRSQMLERLRYVEAGAIEMVEKQRQGWALLRP
jgi:intracellular sulfur oxidation DsrE/DsrF family protein